MAEQEFPTHDPFTEFVLSQRPFGNAKERLTIIPERLFVARQPDSSDPNCRTIRQYYREIPSSPESADKALEAEIVFNSNGKFPSTFEHFRLLGKNEGDFFEISTDRHQNSLSISAKIGKNEMTVKYNRNSGDVIFISAGETGATPATKRSSELNPREMYRTGQKTIEIFFTSDTTAQTAKAPVSINHGLLEKILPAGLQKDPMTKDLFLDLPWINGDWQGIVGIDWSVNLKHINIRSAVR